jgi:hypothetical protein
MLHLITKTLHFFYYCLWLSGCLLFMFSCTSTRLYYDHEQPEPEVEDRMIIGRGISTREQMVTFLLQHNEDLQRDYAAHVARVYIYEAEAESIDHDIAFVQMCLESGFLAFSGVTAAEQNNFAGMGAVDTDTAGDSFASVELGIRAHIQHLKAYASEEKLNQKLVDDRFKYVERGSAPTLRELEGKWSTDPGYAEKLRDLLQRLYESR